MRRPVYIAFCFVVSCISAYVAAPLISENDNAVTIAITVMTVFAGFLVAIISILGDPAMIPKGSWRKAEIRHGELEATIIRHATLFYLYLIAIGLLFAAVLFEKEPQTKTWDSIRHWIDVIFMFFAVFSFLLTLSLPSALGKIQLQRSVAEIERRRTEANIPKNDEH